MYNDHPWDLKKWPLYRCGLKWGWSLKIRKTMYDIFFSCNHNYHDYDYYNNYNPNYNNHSYNNYNHHNYNHHNYNHHNYNYS